MIKGAMKAPIKPRQFNSISASSKIDAWSVVDENENDNIKQHKRTPSNNSVTKSSVVEEDKQIEDELSHQNISLLHHFYSCRLSIHYYLF